MVLTPPGVAAIAVVRLCGPLNEAFAAAHLSRIPKVGRCVHADVRDADVLDDAVVVRTPAGHLDLNLHGGAWVVASVLRLAEAFGFRVREWRAVDAAVDADDEIERQTLLDLPRALSPAVLRLLAAQPAAWRAMLAAGDRDAMRRAVDDKTLATALAVPSVAIVGPPNVGKSTLANALAGVERSITADAPGTTRDWVGGLADFDGVVVRLIDTPGVRATDDAIEAEAIARSAGVVAEAACVIVAVDGSRPPDAAARAATGGRGESSTIVVLTKSDLPSKNDHADAIPVSARTGDGLPALRAAVLCRLLVEDIADPRPRCWTKAQRSELGRRLGPGPPSI